MDDQKQDDQNTSVIPAQAMPAGRQAGIQDNINGSPSESGMTKNEPTQPVEETNPVIPNDSEESPTDVGSEVSETSLRGREPSGRIGSEISHDVRDDNNESSSAENADTKQEAINPPPSTVDEPPKGKWYVVHTYSGHENKVATQLTQRVESEHLENKIFDILVPTQDKIEIRSGKKASVKEKIFPGYILVKMDLDDVSWLAVRTTQGVTSFVGIGNRPTPVPEHEVASIIKFMTQGAAPTFKDVFLIDDTVKIIDGPFADFIGKVESVDKERGKVRVLVSIFGRETPVELDFLQVTKL